MKTNTIRAFVALLIGTTTFTVGLVAASVWSDTSTKPTEPIIPATAPPVYPTTDNLAADELSDPIDLGCWRNESDDPRFGPVELSRGLVLSTVCGTIFVRTYDGKLLWSETIPAGLTDEPKLINGELVVIGNDLVLLGLDPNTGDRIWTSDSNGRSSYIQTERFGKEMYVLLTDMSGYENGNMGCFDLDNCPRDEPDRITLFRRDTRLYDWSVPAGSRIEVTGRHIFATYRHGKNLKRLELRLPRNLDLRNSNDK